MLNKSFFQKRSIFAAREAFTLVEVVTALFIVMVGTMSGYGLLNQTIAASSSISMRLTAAYLGKEGIEIVKNIRDSNFMQEHKTEIGAYNWMDGLASSGVPSSIDCSAASAGGGCVAQYDDDALSNTGTDQVLKYSESTGFFNYNDPNSTPTVFKRLITIEPMGDTMSVAVSVSWSERGKPFSLTVRENLYNWFPN